VIFNTVFLTAPAQLVISSGGNLSTNALAAGIQSLRTPFAPGPQSFTLRRNGTNLLYVHGPTILPQITNYDFFPASGYAYGTFPPNSSSQANVYPTNYILPPPTNLHVVPETY
jgi:hypothetical protein